MPDLRPIFRVLLLTVAIMSGALSLLREFLQFVDPTKYPEKSLFYACLRVACILAFALLWWEEKKARVRTDAALNDTRPNLVLSLGNLIWIYDSAADKTVFFLSASVVNRGQPSVTLSWRAHYKVGQSLEDMTMFHLRDSYSVTIKNEKLTFTNADLLNLKTIENPVAKGQFVGGRLLLTVPGDRTAQINSLQHVINVECEDYLGRISTGGYIPDSKPLTSLVIYHTEKVELAMQPESASYTPQLRSGEGEA